MNKIQLFTDRILQNRIVSHILFWVSFLLVFTILASLNSGTFKYHIINYLAMIPAQMAAAYVLNYYQIPHLLLKKKYVLFFASLLFYIYVFSAFGRFSIVYIAEPFIREDFTQESILEILSDTAYLFAVYFPGVYTYAFIMLIAKAIKDRFEEKNRIETLLKEKATSELKFLKAQIQPHFLFNTLNNLYALTLAKSDVAPQVVLKLSELLDFILYQSDQPSIPIKKEIELIEGFIELESLRYGALLDLSFDHQIDDQSTPLSPLLLLPLIENAFKHGFGEKTTKTMININLLVENRKLHFEISNSKHNVVNNKDFQNQPSGIGTTNLKRRLALNYPDKYELQSLDKEAIYSVKLYIDLN